MTDDGRAAVVTAFIFGLVCFCMGVGILKSPAVGLLLFGGVSMTICLVILKADADDECE